MPCENELKEALGDYLWGVLPDTKAAMVREHLNQCPDCRSDLEQLQFLLPGLTKLAEEHIPAETLADYAFRVKTSARQMGTLNWGEMEIEEHLPICDRCRSELDKLTTFEKEFQRVSKKSASKPSFEKTVLKRRVFLRSRRVLYAAMAAAALFLFLIPNLPLRSQGPMIAVLPFTYEGPAEKEFYADGIADEISKNLEKISAVGVIASTSTLQYKNTAKKPGQIGRELGVDYILMGSIRYDTSGRIAKLRVAPRLVRAKNQAEIWREPFEIVWGEICNLPGVIARKVVSALNIEILEPEHRALESCPTGNIEAYEYYLRGNNYFYPSYPKALEMYQKAIDLDPGFALAYANLAFTHMSIYWELGDRSDERLINAKEAVDKAFQLVGDLPEAHLALGYYYYWGSRDYERALEEFTAAQKNQPNNAELFAAIGYVQRRQGKWEKAVANLMKATKIDPRNQRPLTGLAGTYLILRKYVEAERCFDRNIKLSSVPGEFHQDKCWLYVLQEGNTKKARKLQQEAFGKIDTTELSLSQAELDFLDGDYQMTLNRLPVSGYYYVFFPYSPSFNIPVDTALYFLYKARIYGLLNNPKSKHLYSDSARAILETKAKTRPEDSHFHALLGLAYAGLGRKEKAIREGRTAVKLLPVSRDAYDGPEMVKTLASIYVAVGEPDLAIDQLEYLLSIPSFVSVPYLRIDPIWAPLRSHPRFQKLLNERA